MTPGRTDGGHVFEWLDAWRTDELDPDRSRMVEDHLETCAECREALADLEAFATSVEAGYRAGEATLPEPDWGARRAAVVERTSGRDVSRAPWILRWAPQVAIVAIAAVAIGVVVEKGVRGPDDVERALRAPSAERRAPSAAPEVAADEDVAEPTAEPEPAREPVAPPSVDDDAQPPAAEAAPEARREDARRREARVGADRMEEARVEPDRGAVDEAAAPEGEADAGPAAAMQKAAPEPAERFRQNARAALEARDTLQARDALDFWADSVEPAELPAERRASLQALADSLAALLPSPPAGDRP